MIRLKDDALDELSIPLQVAERVLAFWGLEPTSPQTSHGHIRYWETARPYSPGVVLHVRDGGINVIDIVDALQRRGVGLDEIEDSINRLWQR